MFKHILYVLPDPGAELSLILVVVVTHYLCPNAESGIFAETVKMQIQVKIQSENAKCNYKMQIQNESAK